MAYLVTFYEVDIGLASNLRAEILRTHKGIFVLKVLMNIIDQRGWTNEMRTHYEVNRLFEHL